MHPVQPEHSWRIEWQGRLAHACKQGREGTLGAAGSSEASALASVLSSSSSSCSTAASSSAVSASLSTCLTLQIYILSISLSSTALRAHHESSASSMSAALSSATSASLSTCPTLQTHTLLDQSSHALALPLWYMCQQLNGISHSGPRHAISFNTLEGTVKRAEPSWPSQSTCVCRHWCKNLISHCLHGGRINQAVLPRTMHPAAFYCACRRAVSRCIVMRQEGCLTCPRTPLTPLIHPLASQLPPPTPPAHPVTIKPQSTHKQLSLRGLYWLSRQKPMPATARSWRSHTARWHGPVADLKET